jgi:hypothetical protein
LYKSKTDVLALRHHFDVGKARRRVFDVMDPTHLSQTRIDDSTEFGEYVSALIEKIGFSK